MSKQSVRFNPQLHVGVVVALNYATASVFSKYGIDFCCGGGIKLERACQTAGISFDELKQELEQACVKPSEDQDVDWNITQLVDHIIGRYHSEIRAKSPLIQSYMDKIASVHGERHPELLKIQKEFEQAALALDQHMAKEEKILFPYLKKLDHAQNTSSSMPMATFGQLEDPIAMMEHEHEVEGKRFRYIRSMSNDYSCPADGCKTYAVAFAMLEDFEQKLHRHIHLENNILFPKSRILHKNLKLNGYTNA